MTKFIETLNKLIATLIPIAVVGGLALGGLWVYQTVAELTAIPIQMPTVDMPKIKMEAPEIKINPPKIDWSGFWGGESAQEPHEDPLEKLKRDHPMPDFSAQAALLYSNLRDPCAHSPTCTSFELHAFNVFQDRTGKCHHTPPCLETKVFYAKHSEEMYADCEHSPKCLIAALHWAHVYREGGK